jgi:hypothetical protein
VLRDLASNSSQGLTLARLVASALGLRIVSRRRAHFVLGDDAAVRAQRAQIDAELARQRPDAGQSSQWRPLAVPPGGDLDKCIADSGVTALGDQEPGDLS